MKGPLTGAFFIYAESGYALPGLPLFIKEAPRIKILALYPHTC
jgi:hypothetical protein